MIYIEAPRYIPTAKSIFLAGGITGCPDWQKEASDYILDKTSLNVYNPRRENFDINDPDASKEQIIWEFDHLKKADAILFWFPETHSTCPIALFELGRWLDCSTKTIFIGWSDKYSRAYDLHIQLKLLGNIGYYGPFHNLKDMLTHIEMYQYDII